jgi:SAM-dependent methyltransferase
MSLERISIDRYASVRGHGWSFLMPLSVPIGDSADAPERSTIRLFEEGQALGPGHASRTEVCDLGRGRFLHSGRRLIFSTSDNSDPHRNGRRYEIAVTTLVPIQTGPLAAAASYALSTFETIESLLGSRGIDSSGKVVLEIGPGQAFGAQLLLADHCAKVIVADPSLIPWRDEHLELYRLIQAAYGKPSPALDQAIAQHSIAGVLMTLTEPAETLASLPDGHVDIIFSNAVLEHITDLEQSLVELYRVSSPGAWHFHQIDLRDHRSFTTPLEHLLLSRPAFQQLWNKMRGECGCQWRLSEFTTAILQAGFTIVEAEPFPADAAYLADLLPRLRASDSPYALWSAEDMSAIGAWFVLRKP